MDERRAGVDDFESRIDDPALPRSFSMRALVLASLLVAACGGAFLREEDTFAPSAPAQDAAAIDVTTATGDASTVRTPSDDASDARPSIPCPHNPIEAAAAWSSPCSCDARRAECADAGYLAKGWPSCAFDSACDASPFHPVSCAPYRSDRLGIREGCTTFGSAVCCEPK